MLWMDESDFQDQQIIELRPYDYILSSPTHGEWLIPLCAH